MNIFRWSAVSTAVLAVVGTTWATSALADVAKGATPPAPAVISRLLDGSSPVVKVAGQELSAEPLRNVYVSRGFQPVWAPERREKLLGRIAAAAEEGLDASAYHLAAIKALAGGEGEKAMQLDLLLTDAMLRFGRDMRMGRVDPTEAEQDWQHPRPSFDAAGFFAKLVKDDAAMDGLAPPYAAYEQLRRALAKFRDLRQAGGWPTVVGGDSVKPGEDNERIPQVRARLAVTGEYSGDLGGTVYDEALQQAVKLFQQRHGLEPDAVIGRGTVAAMNVSVDARIAQIAANMERWRWVPRALERRHIAVNIAAAQLQAVEDGKVTMATRVIVGKPTNKTYSFRAVISSVTLNPPWNVPASIATKEILPELRKNPGYLIANRLKIVGGGFAPGSPEQDGIGIDWRRYKSFPYQLRQIPGPENSLGRVKFNMPNEHDIYLHDTPSRNLFARSKRTFSHGCVRVQDPVKLAALVLDKPALTPEKLQEMIDQGETQILNLAKPVPIYLFYFSAWVDEDGAIHFRDDVYGYDKALRSALARPKKTAELIAKG